MQEQRNIPHFHRKLLLICLLMVSCLIGYAPMAKAFTPQQVRVVDGTLDMSQTKLDQVIKLDGEWRFYWKQLLTTEELTRMEPDAYVHVPGSWTEYALKQGNPDSYGYATFALRLKNLKPGVAWALDIPSMSTAYVITVNGKQIAKAGVVSTEEHLVQSHKGKHVVSFTVDSPDAEIMIHMANIVSLRGGLTLSILFGEDNVVRQAQLSKVAYETFLVGALFIMGLYHLGLFWMRTKERSPLYFGMFCFIVALRGLLTGETLIYHLLPDLNWIVALKLEYATLSVSVIAFTCFVRGIFPGELTLNRVRGISLVCLIYLMLTTLMPIHWLPITLPVFQVFILLAISYAVYVFVRAMLRKREGANLSVFGALLLTLSIFNDILFNRGFVQTGYYLSLGLLAFIVAQSFILAISFSKAFSSSEELTEKLQNLNTSLEEKVSERTRELEQLNLTLRKQTLIDGMTGIPNRRHFEELSGRLLGQHRLQKTGCSLLLLDIDHFKMYNDTYGHLTGDDCLRAVAAALQDEAAATGATAARYGGEEFVIIAPFGMAEAEQLADRVVTRIRRLNIPHAASATAPHVTISCGIASTGIDSREQDCPTLQQLLQQADEALYKAKQSGRNKAYSELTA